MNLKLSLSLPVEDSTKRLNIPVRKLKARVLKYEQDERVEPVQITLSDDELKSTSSRLANENNVTQLERNFAKQMKMLRPNSSEGSKRTVTIDKAAFAEIDPKELGKMLAKTHHKLTIDSDTLKRLPQVRKQLIHQVRGFLSPERVRTVSLKLKNGVPVDVDTELLPDFARRMVGRYIIFRGPNCFHAALAFHNEEFTTNPMFNIKREEGYHEVMINYDELWRILNSQFYEVNASTTPLNYGDLIVYFDVTEGAPISYKWIRHAAAYLFGNYVFSKGSKSPNTPYSVKTMDEEWNTWKQYSKKLGVKVFRRGIKNGRTAGPEKLNEWLY